MTDDGCLKKLRTNITYYTKSKRFDITSLPRLLAASCSLLVFEILVNFSVRHHLLIKVLSSYDLVQYKSNIPCEQV